MKSGDYVVCLDAKDTKGHLMNGARYIIDQVAADGHAVRLLERPGELYAANRFKVMEQINAARERLPQRQEVRPSDGTGRRETRREVGW